MALERVRGVAVMTVLALAGSGTLAGAQQPNASVAAAGLGGFTALARGYNAVAWNPANLALSGNPSFSITIVPFGGNGSLNPITLGDIKDVQDQTLVSKDTRQKWLDQVTAKGTEQGAVDLGVTQLGLSMGSLGFQVGSTVYAVANMNPDAVEALLFGNAGKTGVLRSFNFKGSNLRGGAFTTAAVSYGFGMGDNKPGSSRTAFGVTAKYVIGHVTAIAQDAGSTTDSNKVNLVFPIVHTSTDDVANSGNGFGADIGFSWQADQLTFGAAVQNAFNTFTWDTSKLRFRPGTATFDANGGNAKFDDTTYALAPASMKTIVENNKFKPTISAGIAYEFAKDITFTADGRQQLSDDQSIVIGPKTQVGGGIEYRGIPMLPLRVGAAYITGGTAFSGGVSLHIGGYELGGAVTIRQGDNKGSGTLLSLFSIR
jgi:hypothetical protein